MRTIETTATVTRQGTVTVQVPPEIEPGDHRLVVVIDDGPLAAKPRLPLRFPVDDVGPWPEGLSLRREDMYDDWGR